jgi:hypothetical protein
MSQERGKEGPADGERGKILDLDLIHLNHRSMARSESMEQGTAAFIV